MTCPRCPDPLPITDATVLGSHSTDPSPALCSTGFDDALGAPHAGVDGSARDPGAVVDDAHAALVREVEQEAAAFHATMARLERDAAAVPAGVYFRRADELLDEQLGNTQGVA